MLGRTATVQLVYVKNAVIDTYLHCWPLMIMFSIKSELDK